MQEKLLSGQSNDVQKSYNDQQHLQYESDDANYCFEKCILTEDSFNQANAIKINQNKNQRRPEKPIILSEKLHL